ncbi:XRE family transcriptional regulator [Azospirillum sp. TSH7]|uniref:helix-turn-helix domain-containing protein n=1 Tax=unclassified Azospirillum TaxID=2630922 RepID=UPI000D61A334|nr:MULTISPECIES: helix-turn-helix transcriptional regulator [unclassified Azospirillum]PWC67854.1 XRE family transcriptional regulator [Azospirillum sp. TSH7]PWC71141.1 XRE family transcriptional regulator [Azospirillum sp. TSH20]
MPHGTSQTTGRNGRAPAGPPVGALLRSWRQRRGLSQLDLACEADISTRHVSFLETGRSQPSRGMLIHLAERLDVPLRDRNALLVAAGFAPVYSEHSLDNPAMEAARKAVDLVLTGHEPFPALAVDRHWHLLAANRAVAPLLEGVSAELLAGPVNVLRLSLHPDGLAGRIGNWAQWREHVLSRLTRQIETSADPVLVALRSELQGYPAPASFLDDGGGEAGHHPDVVVPLRLHTSVGLLCLFSTTTVFGTAVDVTLSELAIEAFFPADAETAERLRMQLPLPPREREGAHAEHGKGEG